MFYVKYDRNFYIVIQGLKASIAEPADTAVDMDRPCKRHMTAATEATQQ
jgi:hypothetical protein